MDLDMEYIHVLTHETTPPGDTLFYYVICEECNQRLILNGGNPIDPNGNTAVFVRTEFGVTALQKMMGKHLKYVCPRKRVR